MPDNARIFCGVFIFFHEFFCTGESHFVDVFLHLFGRHPKSLIGNVQRAVVFINADFYFRISILDTSFANGGKVF